MLVHPLLQEADMPNGVFPIPQFHSYAGPAPGSRPTFGLRMRTRLGRDRLDEELASGADPASSAELTLRAEQLQSRAVRSRLANVIERMVGDSHSGRAITAGGWQEPRIREYADNLRALVARLRDDRPIAIQGAAMTARLVNDRTSPLYRNGGRSLGSALLSARLALDRNMSIHQDLPTAAYLTLERRATDHNQDTNCEH
jgi:hypothetical protein